jgi:hypothetical protein
MLFLKVMGKSTTGNQSLIGEFQNSPRCEPPASAEGDSTPARPAADLFPPMARDELRVLRKDSLEHGLTSSRMLWRADPQRQPVLLDSRNRLDAIELVTRSPVKVEPPAEIQRVFDEYAETSATTASAPPTPPSADKSSHDSGLRDAPSSPADELGAAEIPAEDGGSSADSAATAP